MKSSVGYTALLDIVLIFIAIIFAFIFGSMSYYKSHKVNSIIEDEIEKYEGFNNLSYDQIHKKLTSLGYDLRGVNCDKHKVNVDSVGDKMVSNSVSALANSSHGYCVYYNVVECDLSQTENDVIIDVDGKENNYCKAKAYNYIIKTYFYFDVPIIHNMLKIPVYTKTNTIYACYGKNCK